MNTTDTQTQAAQLIATAALEAEQTTWEQFYDVHETATDEQKAHAKKEALKDAANARRRIREQAARDAKKLLSGDEPKGKRAARSEAKQAAEQPETVAAAEPLSEAKPLPVYAIEGKEQAVGTVTDVLTYQTKKHGEKVQVTMLTEGGWTAVFNAPKALAAQVEAGRKMQVTATWTPREQQHVADGANPRGAQFI